MSGGASLALGLGGVTLRTGGFATTVSVPVSGSGGLTVSGGGTATLSGSNSFTGPTAVTAGTTVRLSNVNAVQRSVLTLTGGTAALVAAGVNIYLLGGLSGSSNLALGGNTISVGSLNATTTYSGTLSGTGSLALSGTGTLSLTGTNTYTGGTTVSSGTLDLYNDQSAANGGLAVGPAATAIATVNIEAGASVAATAGDAIHVGNAQATGTSVATLNVAGTVTSAATLLVGREGVLNVNNGGTWTQSGSMTVASQGGYPATINVNAGGNLAYTGSSAIDLNAAGGTNAAASATITVPGGAFTTTQGVIQTPGTGGATGGVKVSQSGQFSDAGNAPLPATDADVGTVATTGSATFDGAAWTLTGAGAGIGGGMTGDRSAADQGLATDAFNFLSQPVMGDAEIATQVLAQSSTNAYAQAGVMFRNGTAANANFVSLYQTPGEGVGLASRDGVTDPLPQLVTAAGLTGPVLLRLARVGNTFTGYASTDGAAWVQVGSVTVTMASTASVGLIVSGASSTAGVATFAGTAVGPGPVSNTVGQSATVSTTINDVRITSLDLASVDWGDGTVSTATLTVAGGTATVIASHVYALHGSYQAALSVDDGGGTTLAVVPFTANVGYVAPTVSIDAAVQDFGGPPAHAELHLVDNGPEDPSAIIKWTINWGDGNTETMDRPADIVGANDDGTRNGQWYEDHRYDAAGDYTVTASATDSTGDHDAGATNFHVSPTPTPTVPTGLTVTAATATEVDLAWDAVNPDDSNTYNGFNVLRSDDGGQTFSQIGYAYPLSPTFSDTSVADGTAYVYEVVAFDGNNVSVPATISAATPCQPVSALSGVPDGNDGIQLSWTHPTLAAQPLIEIDRLASDGTWVNIATIDGRAAGDTYVDNGLVAGTSYTYRVRAVGPTPDLDSDFAGPITVPLGVPASSPTVRLSGTGTVSPGSTYTLGFSLFGVPASSITGWSLDWGDGSTSSGSSTANSATHVYSTGGQYRVQATVTTNSGSYSSDAFGLDASFGQGGIATDPRLSAADAVALQPDGHVIVLDAASGVLESFDTNGSVNTTFGSDGVATLGLTEVSKALAVDPLGNIVVVGTSDGQVVVDRLTANGLPDSTFGTDGRVVPFATTPSDPLAGGSSLLIDPRNSQIVLTLANAGAFTVARLNSDGTLDAHSGPDGSGVFVTPSVSLAAAAGVLATFAPDGSLLLAGQTATGGVVDDLDKTGAAIATFNGDVPLAVQNSVSAIAAVANGDIYLATSSASGHDALTAYRADGTPDSTFGSVGSVALPPSAFNEPVSDLAIQGDGDVLLEAPVGTGVVTAEYNATGGVDNTFGNAGRMVTPLSSAAGVTTASFAVQADGQIVAATSVGNPGTTEVIRINGGNSIAVQRSLKLVPQFPSAVIHASNYGLTLKAVGDVAGVGTVEWSEYRNGHLVYDKSYTGDEIYEQADGSLLGGFDTTNAGQYVAKVTTVASGDVSTASYAFTVVANPPSVTVTAPASAVPGGVVVLIGSASHDPTPFDPVDSNGVPLGQPTATVDATLSYSWSVAEVDSAGTSIPTFSLPVGTRTDLPTFAFVAGPTPGLYVVSLSVQSSDGRRRHNRDAHDQRGRIAAGKPFICHHAVGEGLRAGRLGHRRQQGS